MNFKNEIMENQNVLEDGDVFMLQCIGNRPDYRFLDGITANGRVELSVSLIDEDHSGTLWQAHKNGGYYIFRCLDFENQSKRYLDGNVNELSVSIVSGTGLSNDPNTDSYSGIQWQIELLQDGSIQLKNQDTDKYLNGHTLNDGNYLEVDLVTNKALTGTKWRIIKKTDISLGANTFINPIVNRGHDPWAMKHNGSYYYCFVMDNKIYVSQADSLQDIGKVVPNLVFGPGNTAESQNIWAPELHIIDNIWYIIFASGEKIDSDFNQRIRMISSVNPTNGFCNSPMTLETNVFAIDGTFLKRENKLFLIWSQNVSDEVNVKQALYISEIKLTPTNISFIGGKAKISEPTESWELTGTSAPFPTGVNEGPQVLISPDENKIHILYSANGSWTNNYCLGRLTYVGGNSVDDLLNPACWSKHPEPVFSSGQGKTGPFGPGHCSFVRDENEEWIVYHCARYNNAGWTRWIHTQKFTWNDDIPEFGEPIPRFIPLKK